MKPSFPRTWLLWSVLSLCIAPALAAKNPPKPPDGVKVASGQQFDIYVVRKESTPFADSGLMLNTFETTVVVHQTRKHGRQLFRSRESVYDADLIDPAMWQIGDFDGDGREDYRLVRQLNKGGCRTWATRLWLAERERFTHGKGIINTDAAGKPVKVCR